MKIHPKTKTACAVMGLTMAGDTDAILPME